nr:exostosin family protein [Tanacetum cinerariifolium]
MVLKKSNWDIRYSNNYSAAQELVSLENLLDRRWRTVENGGQVAGVPSAPPPVVLEEDMDMQQP